VKNGRTPFNPADFSDFRRAIGTEPTIPNLIGADLTPHAALALAIEHIEHMAAWIAKQNAGYSFESLGEDMPGMRAAVGTVGERS
jgi:hypothetical protein